MSSVSADEAQRRALIAPQLHLVGDHSWCGPECGGPPIEPPPEDPHDEPYDGPGGEADGFEHRVAQEVLRQRVRREANRILAAEADGARPGFDAGTLAEILARPAEPAARVDCVIPWEASTLITAQRKTGKTTLVLNLARSLLTGQSFLGEFAVQQIDQNVAVLNYEVSAAQLARWAHDIGYDDPDRLLLVNLRGRRNPLGHAEDRAQLAQMLREHRTEVLIVDPFSRAFTGSSQNDAGEVGAFLTDLDRFARGEAGCRDLILTAHAGWDGERTRGSSGLEDWADSIITLTRDPDSDKRYIRAVGRDVDLDERELTIDNRHLSLSGGGSRKQAKSAAKDQAQEQTVLDVLADQDGPINTKELEQEARQRSDVGFQHGDTGRACNRLLERGLIEVERGSRGAKLWTRVVLQGAI